MPEVSVVNKVQRPLEVPGAKRGHETGWTLSKWPHGPGVLQRFGRGEAGRGEEQKTVQNTADTTLYQSIRPREFSQHQVPEEGIVCDLMWSDPDPDITGWAENDRGVSYVFGADIVTDFLDKNDFDLVVRAHQAPSSARGFFSALVAAFFSGISKP